MRIEDLLYFRAVAEEHSLTQAAKTLYISQPSLSTPLFSAQGSGTSAANSTTG